MAHEENSDMSNQITFSAEAPKNRKPDMARKIVQKQQSMARRDIADWKLAIQLYTSTLAPKSHYYKRYTMTFLMIRCLVLR